MTQTSTAVETPETTSPSLVKLAMEARALLEAGSFALTYPLLQAAPRGDGHPVLVLPGFLAGDFSTKLLRTFLKSRGYKPFGWGLGRNMGRHSSPETGCGEEIVKRLKHIHRKYGQKVSVIGWSLGGIYARELARLHPELCRQVISMGSPFAGNVRANHAAKLFEKTSGYALHEINPDLRARMQHAPPIPTTAFYSRTDGITAWECCIEKTDASTENIEVPSSHCGMGHHPFVMWAIADRLAQADGQWQPFRARGLERLMFRTQPNKRPRS